MALALTFIFSLIFFATPALFLVVLLNFVAVRFSIWLRAIVSAIVPAILLAPVTFALHSDGNPSVDEKLSTALIVGLFHFGIGFLVAFLIARNHPIPEEDVDSDVFE